MSWSDPHVEAFLGVLLAMLLGSLIGLERELAGKSAGLRTNMLVAGAAAFLVAIAEQIVDHFTNELSTPSIVRIDTIRVIEAVVTGVSFIGAGTIIRRGPDVGVEGLTTAATLLFTAAVGMGAALEMGWLSAGVTVTVLVTLRGLMWLERRLGLDDH